MVKYNCDIARTQEIIHEVLGDFEYAYMPKDFVQVKDKLNHLKDCEMFDYDANVLREAFKQSKIPAIVCEMDSDGVESDTSFSVDNMIDDLEYKLSIFKFQEFSR